MFAIEQHESREPSQPLPSELKRVLKQLLSFGAKYSGQPGWSNIHVLSEQATIDYVADYFNDPKYREAVPPYVENYFGIPVTGRTTADGLRITIGIDPRYDESSMPPPEGLPYGDISPPDRLPCAEAVIPFETVITALRED